VYVSCTVISYDYIDSKHNMVEIHREIRELPDRGNGTEKGKGSWDSTCDTNGVGGVIKGCTDMKQEMLEVRRARGDEESKLKPEIIMIKTNRRCRGERDAVR